MGWQIPSEGLTSITKGKTEGNCGKQANILVAVPYCKGVVFRGQYTETLTIFDTILNIIYDFLLCSILPTTSHCYLAKTVWTGRNMLGLGHWYLVMKLSTMSPSYHFLFHRDCCISQYIQWGLSLCQILAKCCLK